MFRVDSAAAPGAVLFYHTIGHHRIAGDFAQEQSVAVMDFG